MENLFNSCNWDEHWNRLTTPANLINLVLILLLALTGLTMCLALTADAQVIPTESGPGWYPYNYATSVSPDVPGPRIYLMPDGGTWTLMPNALPGLAPPPIYTPPPDYDVNCAGYTWIKQVNCTQDLMGRVVSDTGVPTKAE